MLSFVGPPVARKWAPASNNYVGSCAGSCTCTSTSPSLPWAKHTRFCPSPKKDQKNGIRWNFSKKKICGSLKNIILGPTSPPNGGSRSPSMSHVCGGHGYVQDQIRCLPRDPCTMLSHGRPKVHEAWRTKCWNTAEGNTWVLERFRIYIYISISYR